MFQNQDRNARKLFARLTKLQLKYAFRQLISSKKAFLLQNNFIESQDIPNENTSKIERLKLPPLIVKPNQSQLVVQMPQNTSFHLKEKRDDSGEKVESPGILRGPTNETYRYNFPF